MIDYEDSIRRLRKQSGPSAFSIRHFARLFDVPPWLVDPSYPVPRFRRLRWALRRVWTLP